MLLLSWWGAIVLSFLDSTVFFVIPFGNDALLIYLVARHPANFWLYPLLMTTAALPPPFPLTPFVLTCGALEINRSRFFVLFVLMHVIRFGVEAIFARIYGARVLDFLQSGIVETIVIALVVVSVV